MYLYMYLYMYMYMYVCICVRVYVPVGVRAQVRVWLRLCTCTCSIARREAGASALRMLATNNADNQAFLPGRHGREELLPKDFCAYINMYNHVY